MPDYFDSELNTIELEGEIAVGGGEGGTTNYPDLTNKPQINGIELIGNLAAATSQSMVGYQRRHSNITRHRQSSLERLKNNSQDNTVQDKGGIDRLF